ncbi:response regulator [Aeoliella sp. ICT_H6.2]|uniref:Response regulator n=1 Tax=Aeoliella straminimaris TaxID=2954799 RepID=A0A9X2F7E2_9BACT|nr:response regulator [Aeoliella straminimaris]MCO6043727.1 response regulator [Aeoliella straminimaris]
MLVLSRKPNESIIVTGKCRITVFNSNCKLGIEGPAKVVRAELEPQPVRKTGEKPMVHILDDDLNLLRAYRTYLENSGFRVETFRHGGEYLDSLSENCDASAAMFDLRLAEEDIDGLQVLQQLRARRYDFPVVLLTGYGDVDTCRRAFHSGCYTFLQKPASPEDILTKLQLATRQYLNGELSYPYDPAMMAR